MTIVPAISTDPRTTDRRIIVVGAGPAGCIAAISLARQGHRVALIEQHRFPRDKVCGECLSAVAIETLARLDLKTAVHKLNPMPLTRCELIAPSGAVATIDLPLPMWGLSRFALDAALLEAARQAGAEIHQPARCESIDSKTTTVAIRDLPTNAIRTIRARYILIADGKAACGLAHHEPTTDLGIKAHFQNVRSPTDTISLFSLPGHYVGLAPIEQSHWNVAMSVPAEHVRSVQGNLDALFDSILNQNIELARRFRSASRISDWLASPLPRFPVSADWPENVIPIGNAAAALEPIGGEGMGLAMRSAELAAAAVDTALREGQPIDTAALRRDFNKLWKPRRLAARATAMLMSSPRCAEVLVHAINSIESLARPALIPLGKL